MAKEQVKTGGRTITVDFTGVETGGGRIRIPEGDYGLRIKKIVEKKAESGKPCLFIDFEVIQGDKRGLKKVLTGHSCSLQPQSLWNLRNLLESCGKQVPSKAVKLDLDKMVGSECAGTVTDDEYEGRKKSVISAFFPISDLGKTSESGDELEATDDTEEEPTEEESEEESLFS
jgi:hypothetical protein